MDITSQMLSALTLDTAQENSVEEVDVPLDEQKRYLKRYIDSVNTNDRKSIGHIIFMNNMSSLMLPCSEGSIVNLDKLPPHVVTQMYNLLSYQINKKNSN
jgi:hypothetical protein